MIINNPTFYLGSLDETENDTIDYDFSSLSTSKYQTAKQAVRTQNAANAGEDFNNLDIIDIAEYGVFGLLNIMGNHVYSFNANEIKTLVTQNNAQKAIDSNLTAKNTYKKITTKNYIWIEDQNGVN